jgi:ankyrin repeat protein
MFFTLFDPRSGGHMKFLPFFILASSLVVTTVAEAQLPSHASNEQILHAIHQANDLLNVSEQAWVDKAYCYNCHHEAIKFRLDRLATEHGIAVDRMAANANLRKTLSLKSPEAIGSLDYAAQGTYFVDAPIVDGIQLTSLHDLGVPGNLYLAAYAKRVERLQTPAGYWVTSDRRPPESESYFSATAYAIQAIRDYLPERVAAEKRNVIARAKSWLLTAAPRGTEDESMQLFGLTSASTSRKEMEPIAKRLIQEQRADGGWAQIPTRDSDAYATGQALVALDEAGELSVKDPVYLRGIAYLLKTQATDGSWHVSTRLVAPVELSPPPFDFKFPYDDDYVISIFGTEWATQALLLTQPKAKHIEPLYTASDDSGLFPTGPQPDNTWIETALFGTTDELKMLLNKGLSANTKTPGGTPLLQLVATDVGKTKLVLERGADVNVRTKNGFTALTVAANYRGTTEVVRTLLDHGATVACGTTDTSLPLPLFLAAGTGEIEKARLLIAHGDGVNEKWTRRGGSYSPLINAIDMGDAPMVAFLIDSGADIHERDLRGLTPLSRAVLSNYNDVVAVLIAKGADVNAPDGLGLTPLHYASMADYGDTGIVRQLLASGAKRDIKDSQGHTPLQTAERFHYDKLASALR